MTIEAASASAPSSWHALAADPRLARIARSTGIRLVVGGAVVVVAFHYSFLTLLRSLSLDTPLAYLGLVPLIAGAVALAVPRTTSSGPQVQDRQLDYIVGLPLVAGCVAATHLLPHRMSTVYWTDRLDLLTLPFFVLGVSVLLFGIPAAWRFRAPVLLLLLAWPYPYTLLIENGVDVSTSVTLAGLRAALHVVPVATQAPGGDGSLFHVAGSDPFDVSIASACAGVNSMVGFLILGLAILTVTRQRPLGRHRLTTAELLSRKVCWLALGLVAVWLLNIVRLVLVLLVGRQWGEPAAVDGLHPYIGMVVFAAAAALVVFALPVFGLQITRARRPADAVPRPIVRQFLTPARQASRLWPPGLLLLAAALTMGRVDASFSRYQLVAGDLGQPRLASFDERPAVVGGTAPPRTHTYGWATRYFGRSSTWHRYEYAGLPGAPVVADVIDATRLSPFDTYGIEACYAFHGYTFSHERAVDLGGGVQGHVLSYREPGGTLENVTYWIWAVRGTRGTRYERVVLIQPSDAMSAAPSPQSSPLVGVGYSGFGSGAPAVDTQSYLVGFARQIVANQPAATRPAAVRRG